MSGLIWSRFNDCQQKFSSLHLFIGLTPNEGPITPHFFGASLPLMPDRTGLSSLAQSPPPPCGPPPCQRAYALLSRLAGDGGSEISLEFRDIRKFGRLHLTKGGPAPRLASLGPDAWRGAWDAAYLSGRLNKRSAPLKSFLLDQRHLAGIGNIYADEILWWTKLSPLRPAGSLSEPRSRRSPRRFRAD